jgi:aspartyl/asparaginyl-tRNA synthetase
MAAKRHSIEYLREVAHLRPRTNLIGAVLACVIRWRRRCIVSSMSRVTSGCLPR